MSDDGQTPPVQSKDGEPKISAAAALQDVVAQPTEARTYEDRFDEMFLMRSINGEREFAKLAGLRDHFRHKKLWSWFLMGLMAFMVGFQSWLIWQVGIRHWNFMGYQWLLPTLMVQYLVQIVGLALFVVRSLFKQMD